eukprot:6459152-Amphidinium_carterae.1
MLIIKLSLVSTLDRKHPGQSALQARICCTSSGTRSYNCSRNVALPQMCARWLAVDCTGLMFQLCPKDLSREVETMDIRDSLEPDNVLWNRPLVARSGRTCHST